MAGIIEFHGRANRPEYWKTTALCWAAEWVLIMSITIATGANQADRHVIFLSGAIIMPPLLAVTARRLRDINLSAWWCLVLVLPVIGFLFSLAIGTPQSTEHTEYRRPPGEGPTATNSGVGPSGKSAGDARPASTATLDAGATRSPSTSQSQRPSDTNISRIPPAPRHGAEALDNGALMEDPYLLAGRELETETREPAAWARALVAGAGDLTRTHAEYVRLRVAGFQAEAARQLAIREAAAAEAADQLRQRQAALEKEQRDQEVSAYAAAQGVTVVEAEEMLPWGIVKTGDRFRFRGYGYERLGDAVAYASGESLKRGS